MLQYISEYWKLNGNLIVNDFDKPYIVIDTAGDSRFRSISILSHLVLSFVGSLCNSIHFLLGIL